MSPRRASLLARRTPAWSQGLLVLALVAVLLAPAGAAALLPGPAALESGGSKANSAAELQDAPHDCPPQDPVEALSPGCPTRIHLDGHVLGRPAVVVNPRAPSEVAAAAIGGLPAQGPTASSRSGGHVFLFLSRDAAGSFDALALPPPPGDLLAEDVALASDAQGRLVVAGLFSEPGAPAPSVLATWRVGSLAEALAGAPPAEVLAPWASGAHVARIGLAHVPATDQVALVWEEVGVAPATDERSSLGPAGYVRHALGPAAPGSAWDAPVAPASVVGPCRDLAGPVAWQGQVFFGCAAETGMQLPEERIVAGELVFHALDAASGNVTYTGWVPLTGQAVLTLVDAREGRLGLLMTEVLTPTEVRVVYTTARLAGQWTGPRRLGDDLHNATLDPPVRDAAVLAMGVQRTTGMVFAVYRELPAPQPEPTPAGDPAALGGEPRMTKWLVRLSPTGGFLTKEDLGVDDAQARLLRGSPDAGPLGPPPFPADPEDAVASLGSRNFLAYADAGDIVVGELVGSPVAFFQPPPPVDPSEDITALTRLPPRAFQPWFAAAGIALGALMVGRVLLGRLRIANRRLDEARERGR